VIRTIAGFLNSEGGVLLSGVEDNKNIIGLASDFKTLGKHQDKDGFENLLTTLLLDACGKDISPLLQIMFHALDRNTCEAVEYCKIRWK